MKTSIAVCCPGEFFSSRWVKNWTELLAHLKLVRGLSVEPLFEFSSVVYATRNALAEACLGLDLPEEYVLWIDDDNILTPESFDKLWNRLHTQKDAAAVAAWAWCENDQYPQGAMVSCGHIFEDGSSRPFTSEELIGTAEEVRAGRGHSNLIEVGYTGFPAILMHTSTIQCAGPNPFNPYIGDEFMWGMSGEDYAFCRRARERAGCKFYVDPLCQVPHLKLRAIQPTRLLQFGKSKECAA